MPITPEQVQYFPQARPRFVCSGAHPAAEPHPFSAPVFDVDAPERLVMSDLGQPIDVSHACGKTFLLHFAGGENIQLRVDVETHTELIARCLHALEAIMDPPEYRRFLHGYHRRVISSPFHHAFRTV